MQPCPALDAVAAIVRNRARAGEVLVVGVTGSVAAGKTTLCEALTGRLAPLTVEILSTDGSLMPNAVLAERGVLARKGFPETYDADALLGALRGVRLGSVETPVHSHIVYDIDPAATRTIAGPDVLLVEGLGLSGFPDGRHAADALDLLIYLDADEADLERWYVDRFIGFWRAAATDAASFYARFRALDQAGAEQLARSVWTGVNRVNLRDHVIAAMDRADILLRKDGDHALSLVRASV